MIIEHCSVFRQLAKAPGFAITAVLFTVGTCIAFSSEPPVQHDQAINLFQAQKLHEAQDAFEKLAVAEPNNAEPTYYLGEIALKQGDAETSVRWLEKAVSLNSEESNYYKAFGDAYGLAAQKAGIFSKAGFAKKGFAALDKAVALDPNNLDARESRVNFYRNAPSFVGGGMSKAYAEAAEVQKRNPLRGAGILGELYLAEKKYAEAFILLEETITKNPDNKALLYQVGRVAAISGLQLDRGEAALKEYLQHGPTPNEPPHHDAHWRLGALYEKKGDKAAARAEYEAALRLQPDFGKAQAALKELK